MNAQTQDPVKTTGQKIVHSAGEFLKGVFITIVVLVGFLFALAHGVI